MRVKDRITINGLVLSCLIIFSIIPNIGITFSAAGLTWTAYRIVILISLGIFCLGNAAFKLDFGSASFKWAIFMAFWLIYGVILLFLGKYSDFHNGGIELLSIFNGFVVIFIAGLFLNSSERIETALKCLYWLLNLLILLGLFEIVTGRHLPMSGYHDPQSPISEYVNTHMATGLMYNMNDFSAMLTCMSPILVDARLGKKRLITLLGILFINHKNDATTCTLALFAFVAFFFMVVFGGRNRKAFGYRLILWILFMGMAALFLLLSKDLASRNDVIGAVARQVGNAKQSNGSLYGRLVIYRDALIAWYRSGMLGMGPSGFSPYFIAHPSVSELVNPHSLILEILSQYGIIVCSWFVGLLVMMFHSGRKLYEMADERCRTAGLMVFSFVIIYSLASFAPSTFIGHSYQWLLIAVMCSQINCITEKGGTVCA